MRLSSIEYIGARPPLKKKRSSSAIKAVFLILAAIGMIYSALRFGANDLIASQALASKEYSVQEFIETNLDLEKTQDKLVAAALSRTLIDITYDPAYYVIDYPMGDVPSDKGVCTDVVIRSYRELDIDLQELVHDDMGKAFSSYPKNWNLKKRDSNIDHRRVPNLKKFFSRHGKSMSISNNIMDYQYGDIVTWKLTYGAPHIGIVVPSPIEGDPTPWIVHNIGMGPQWENCIFDYKITGHYRYKVD